MINAKNAIIIVFIITLSYNVFGYTQHITQYGTDGWGNINNANDSDWNTYASSALDKYLFFNVTLTPPSGESFSNTTIKLTSKIFCSYQYAAPVPYLTLQVYNYSSGSWRTMAERTPQSGSGWLTTTSSPLSISQFEVNSNNLSQFRLEGVQVAYFYEANVTYSLREIGFSNCSDGSTIITFLGKNITSYEQDQNYTMDGFFSVRSTDESYGFYSNKSVSWTGANLTQRLCVFPALNDNLTLYGQLTYRPVGGNIQTYFVPEISTSVLSPTEISLYFHESVSNNVLIRVVNENDEGIQNAYVYIRKYDIGDNIDYLITVLKTDQDGYIVAPLVLDTQYYTILVTKNSETLYTSQPTLITSVIKTIRIQEQTDFYTTFSDIYNIDASLTFTNTTKTFELDYINYNENFLDVCLSVYNQRPQETELLYNNCSSDITSIIRYNYSDVTNPTGTYYATAYIIIDGVKYTLTTTSHTENYIFKNWGDSGLFLALGLIITMIMMGVATRSPTMIVVYSIIGTVFASLVTLLSVTFETIIIIVVLGGVATYLISRRNY